MILIRPHSLGCSFQASGVQVLGAFWVGFALFGLQGSGLRVLGFRTDYLKGQR